MSAFGAATIARKLVEPQAELRDLASTLAPAQRTLAPGPDSQLYRGQFAQYLAAFV
jgi:hypothetical protein